MYYILGTDPGITAYVEPERESPNSLVSGVYIDPAGEPLPYRYRYHDLLGNPLHEFDSGTNLMSKRLISVIQGCGVDNLQTFQVELVDESTGSETDDFCVVNVVGLVACANVESSESSPLGGGYYFHNLVIDKEKTRGLLIFRLAESLIDILVDEKVAQEIKKHDFRGVTLTAITDSE